MKIIIITQQMDVGAKKSIYLLLKVVYYMVIIGKKYKIIYKQEHVYR